MKIESLVSDTGDRALTIEKFFSVLESEDDEFQERVDKAKADGKALRYMATLENDIIDIGLKEIDASHPFYSLSGSDNMIVFTTERYKDRPLVVKGPGAGAEVTAAGVFAEIISIGTYLTED